MNAREVMRRAFRETVGIPEGDYFRSDVFDAQLDALAEAGFVVVACPPGSRVVVSRESKPCETCHGIGRLARPCPPGIRSGSLVGRDVQPCEQCDGSGVVEATTTYGLEPVTRKVPGEARRVPIDGTFMLVALPEETPVSDETVFVVQWAKDYSDHPPVAVFRTEAEAEAWAAPLNDEHEHYWVTEVPLWRAADKE